MTEALRWRISRARLSESFGRLAMRVMNLMVDTYRVLSVHMHNP